MKKITIIVLVLIVVAAIFFIGRGSDDNIPTGNAVTGNAVSDAGSAITQDADNIIIPLGVVSTNIKKLSFNADGVNVKYFVVLGTDGEPRVAFDACDVCGGYKGYSQQGDDIACNNCGRVFSIDGLGTKNKGYGCWPSFLSHEVVDGNVIIKKADIREGAFRFA